MRTVTLLIALIAAPAAAQDAIPLKWSLKEGDKFFASNETEMNMSITALGQTQDIKMTISAVQRFKVLSAKQDSTSVEMTMLSMEMKSPIPIPGGVGAIGEKVKGATLTAILDDKMKVTKLQGYDKFLDKLADGDETARKVFKQQFSEASMSQMVGQVFSFGNDKPVKVGDTWPRTESMQFAGFDTTAKMKCKLDSVTDGIAKIGWTGDLTFKAGAAIPGLPDGIQVDKFEMKAEKLVGTMKFDTKIGRLTENNQDADMDGSMTIAAGGMKIDMTMKIKLKQKVTIGDKNPIKD
jgi:hypothetical protein